MKGDITLAVLRLIQTGDMITRDILDTISYFGYVETYERMKDFHRRRPEIKPILQKPIKNLEERQRISKLLCKLKNEGLIIKETKNGGIFWKITKEGRDWLLKLRPKKKSYSKINQSNEIKIVVFDIPEKKRGYRDWLREVLKNLKFKMLQKSVWVGKTVLPEEFFNDLQRFGLLSYIEIFSITKTGTIKQIK